MIVPIRMRLHTMHQLQRQYGFSARRPPVGRSSSTSGRGRTGSGCPGPPARSSSSPVIHFARARFCIVARASSTASVEDSGGLVGIFLTCQAAASRGGQQGHNSRGDRRMQAARPGARIRRQRERPSQAAHHGRVRGGGEQGADVKNWILRAPIRPCYRAGVAFRSVLR